MSNKPDMTILIPTYNRVMLLEKSLNSILNQSYSNIEIIIGDNHSNDGTEELCRKYAKEDKRIKYFRHSKNIGTFKNGLFLVNQSTSDYTSIICDDDWVSNNYAEEIIKLFKANEDSLIVAPTTWLYNEDYSIYKKCDTINFIQDFPHERMSHYIKYGVNNLVANVCYKTPLLIKSFKNVKKRFCEDQLIILKMLYLGKCLSSQDVIYHKLNNGCTKDLEALKRNWNLPEEITHQNYWEYLAREYMDSILYDEFYNDKLSEYDKIKLAIILYETTKEHYNPKPVPNKKKKFVQSVIDKVRGKV